MKSTVHRKQATRNKKGNFYILYVGLAAAILVTWNIYANIGLSYLVSYRSKCALEAAALAAARDLSRIVVNDPKWGYVALTDQPPVGDDTIAADGYPLPVTGINTIFATTRLELLVAHKIGSNEAIDCAMEDIASARAAYRRLARTLRNSLKSDDGRSSGEELVARDIYGREVKPLVSASDLYRRNANQLCAGLGWSVDEISGELGSLDFQASTNTPIPGCPLDACVDDSLAGGGSVFADRRLYPAFVNVPAHGENFSFAGLGKQAGLVEAKLFEKYDSSKTCSIVRLIAQLRKNDGKSFIKSVACAQPAYMEDKVPSAYMVLRFPNGLPSGITTLRDLMTSEGLHNKIQLFTASGGDFPVDKGAVLKENPDKPSATVKQTFTRAFFDWLRTAHARTNLDSIAQALDYQFNKQHVSTTYLFTISNQGEVEVLAPQNYPFSAQTAYENQLYSVAFNAINAHGVTWTLRMRDQVHRLGNLEGGKHAGQPMPSNVAVDANQDEAKRMLDKAGSRYDRSRLGLEIEISSPMVANGGNI